MKKIRLAGVIIISIIICSIASGAALLSEGFNDATTPAGWSESVVSGSASNINYVTKSTDISGPTAIDPYEGARFAEFPSYFYGDADIRLETPAFSSVGYSEVRVSLAWAEEENQRSRPDHMLVQWSTNGVDWFNVEKFYRCSALINNWGIWEFALPQTACGLASLQIGFHFVSGDGMNCRLDDVNITGIIGPFNPAAFTNAVVQAGIAGLSWLKNTAGDKVIIAANSSDTFEFLTNGVIFSVGDIIPGGGEIIYKGTDTAFSYSNSSAEILYYNAWSVDSGDNYSTGVSDTKTIELFPYIDSFETGLAAWKRSPNTALNWHWIRNTGETPRPDKTGVTKAHDGLWYLYLEASGGGYLQSVAIDANFNFGDVARPELSLYYHMFGSNTGSLSVDAYDGIWHSNVWSISGQQQTNSVEAWKKGYADLSAFAGNENVIVRVRSTGLGSSWGDICIDKIELYNDIPRIDFWPDVQKGATYSGSGIDYTLTLENKINTNDTFDLIYESNKWEITGPAATGLINNDQSTSLTVHVEVPFFVTPDTVDTSFVYAVAQNNPSITGMARIVTTCSRPMFGAVVSSGSGDQGCVGVEFDGEYFWIAGAANAAPNLNYMYKFNTNWNYISRHEQGSSSTWGWGDLAFDGTYIYGSDSDVIETFNPATGQNTGATIPGPLIDNSSVTYDPVKDHFWVAFAYSDIYEIDRAGNIINIFKNDFGKHGIAWDNVSPDGNWLWIWEYNHTLWKPVCHQFDPVKGELTGLSFEGIDLPDYNTPGGACVARYDNAAMFFGVHQGYDDYVVAYKLADLPDGPMFYLYPSTQSGSARPGERAYFSVNLLNRTGGNDSFSIFYQSDTSASGPAATSVVKADDYETINVSILVPAGEPIGNAFTTTVTGVSLSNPSVSNTASLIATVEWFPYNSSLWCQDFEGDWTNEMSKYQTKNPNDGWKEAAPGADGTGSCAYHSNGPSYYVDYLVTPAISVNSTGFDRVILSFNNRVQWTENYLHSKVMISSGSSNPNDGDFVELLDVGTTDILWTKREIDITAYAGTTNPFYIAFLYGGGAHRWYIDDICVAGQVFMPTSRIDWCIIDQPAAVTSDCYTASMLIQGSVFIAGTTGSGSPTSELEAQLGYGTSNTVPDHSWSWINAAYLGASGTTNDVYGTNIVLTTAYNYDYAMRFRKDNGNWIYADLDGSQNGYDTYQAGKLTGTTPPPRGSLIVKQTLGFNPNFIGMYSCAEMTEPASEYAELADDVRPGSDALIRSVRWAGRKAGAAYFGNEKGFYVRFYDNAPPNAEEPTEHPNNLLHEEFFYGYASESVLTNLGGSILSKYHVDLASPFQMHAGSTYWVSVQMVMDVYGGAYWLAINTPDSVRDVFALSRLDDDPYWLNAGGSSDICLELYGDCSDPEINITGNGLTILNGDNSPNAADGTDFGDAIIDVETVTRTFIIENSGCTNLTISNTSVINTQIFSVVNLPGTNVAPENSTSFQVRFEPAEAAIYTGVVSIANNDIDENPYTFTIIGEGIPEPVLFIIFLEISFLFFLRKNKK